jgi:hypothetical protein
MDAVRRIADAVLYEGYLLWPYRRSALKNQRRWTFGGVYPRAHSERHPDDRWRVRAECLLEGSEEVDVRVRFLHVAVREDGWEEAIERELGPGPIAIPAGRDGGLAWDALEGSVDVRVEPGRVVVEIDNTTPFSGDDRQAALRRTFCSTHAVLRSPGSFVSAADAAGCRNEGLWPVLVEDHHTMLASPIILEDFPRIAEESPGDLFDGGEIDELLYLNVLALTDSEKAEMRATDPRAREILERSEALSNEQMLRLHAEVRRP